MAEPEDGGTRHVRVSKKAARMIADVCRTATPRVTSSDLVDSLIMDRLEPLAAAARKALALAARKATAKEG